MSTNKITQIQRESINKFNKMVEKGDLSFQKVDCLCGHSDFLKIAEQDRYGLQQRIVVCKKCGLMMSNPHLTDESCQFFYSTDMYRTLYQYEDYLETADCKLNSDYGKFIFEDLSPMLKERKNLNILEFGCGGGWNLIHFSKAGYKVVGYDYSPNLTQVGRTYGLDLREGTIQDIEGEYDIIIINHVLEHFTDLLGSMVSIIKHLKPNGLLYISVPNIDNYGSGQLQNAHIYYFSPRTFEYYMNRCGLRIIQQGTAQHIHMYGIFEVGSPSSNINILEHEPKIIMKTIRKAQFKQAIGRVLEKMGIKEFIKSSLKKCST
jgi:2-polyprenyl-3-methyl-5-hydroxy-6-metoxy-1,4-benzoquinol methylase